MVQCTRHIRCNAIVFKEARTGMLLQRCRHQESPEIEIQEFKHSIWLAIQFKILTFKICARPEFWKCSPRGCFVFCLNLYFHLWPKLSSYRIGTADPPRDETTEDTSTEKWPSSITLTCKMVSKNNLLEHPFGCEVKVDCDWKVESWPDRRLQVAHPRTSCPHMIWSSTDSECEHTFKILWTQVTIMMEPVHIDTLPFTW